MTLQTGTRLGPYEVVSLVGAGGMGEVYRARDTRLGRSVAIKILPAEVGAELRARFERPARSCSTSAWRSTRRASPPGRLRPSTRLRGAARRWAP